MKSEEHIPRAIRSLKKHYWINILFLALLLVLIVFNVLPFFSKDHPVSVVLERYAVLLPIIAIPLALRQFAQRVKKASKHLAITPAVKLYRRASYQRLYVISSVALIQIVLYGYSGNMNFFWLSIVLFTVFLFCKPSSDELSELVKDPA